MKKKSWLLSFLLIAVTVIIAVSGTTAYFTAQKTSTANKFAIGTLDLDISSATGKLEPINIGSLGAQANIQGEKTWTVKNTGTLPGRLLVKLANVKNLENGCNAPEKEAEINCETDNLGESKILAVSWSANETDYGNEVQSDSVEFDLDFRLIQGN